MNYSVLLVSGEQQGESVIHIHISSFFFLDSFPIQAITEYWVEFPALYSRFLLVIYFIYRSVYMSVPQPLWRTVWRFLKKLKIELPYDLAIPPLGIYPEKTIIWKDMCTPLFIAAPFTIVRTWKQPKCPSTEEWMKKMWYIYTMEYYSAIKRTK